ncbi:MAG: hypothetical protein HFI90_08100 [Clostridia bacterium]|nr:hypothetical protein [Clostridia bacterium]
MKQTMKKWGTLCLCALLCIAILGGCATRQENRQQQAEETLGKLISALKAADIPTAQQYIDMASLESGGIDFTSDAYLPLAKEMFGKLEYEVLSAEEADNENVRLHVKIKAINMQPVMVTWIQNLMQKALTLGESASQMSEEEQTQLAMDGLIEAVQQSGGDLLESEVDVNVTWVDGAPKIQSDRTFANALMGGLMDASEGLQNSLNE